MSTLLEQAAVVDVLDVAGRIIAHPQRQAVAASAAEIVALAHAVNTFWPVMELADMLAEHLLGAVSTQVAQDPELADRFSSIQQFADAIRSQIAAIRGLVPNEGTDQWKQ